MHPNADTPTDNISDSQKVARVRNSRLAEEEEEEEFYLP